jgi:hypothetical protein
MTTKSLTRVCEELGIHATAVYGAVEVPEGWQPGTHPYKVTLRFGRRSLTVPFFMGPARCNAPTAADVLLCLVSDASAGEQSFEGFCSDFGYDVGSRKAEATWKACAKTAPKLRRFLREHFDAVASAEH